MCLEGVVLEAVLPGRGQKTYPGERFAWGTRGRGNLYRLTKKKLFPTTLHVFEYVCKNFLEELAFLCRETFEKLLQPVTFLKMLLFHSYFYAIF